MPCVQFFSLSRSRKHPMIFGLGGVDSDSSGVVALARLVSINFTVLVHDAG